MAVYIMLPMRRRVSSVVWGCFGTPVSAITRPPSFTASILVLYANNFLIWLIFLLFLVSGLSNFARFI